MVEHQLRRRGSFDERVLDAMARVPRELFVPEELRHLAYEDNALPIGSGQTISQPFMVATICQLLELTGDERVLDVGTGSGYQAAVLAELAGHVVSIERIPALAERARVGPRSSGLRGGRGHRRGRLARSSSTGTLRRHRSRRGRAGCSSRAGGTADRRRATRRSAGWPPRAAARARRTHRGRPPRAPERLVQVRAAPRRRGVFGWRLLAQWGVDANALQATLGQSWRPPLETFG